MIIRSASLTDLGKVRKLNEDSFGVDKGNNLFFVCDGMGGHAAGDFASKTAVETALDAFKPAHRNELSSIKPNVSIPLPDSAFNLVSAVHLANRRLFNYAVNYPKLRGMGTTFVGIMFGINTVNICHVGDSRAYRIRSGKMEQLTSDHSWVNELLQDNEITEEEAKNFKQKNVITRAVGTTKAVKVDIKIEEVREGDYFLLCSDGLSGQVSDDELKDIILNSGDDLELACSKMVKAANDTGAPDNVTVIVVKVDELSEKTPISFNTSVEYNTRYIIPPEDDELLKEEDFILKNIYASNKSEDIPQDVKTQKSKFLNPVVIGILSLIAVILVGAVLIISKKPEQQSMPSPPPAIKNVDVTFEFLDSGVRDYILEGVSMSFTSESGDDIMAMENSNVFKCPPGKYSANIQKEGYHVDSKQLRRYHKYYDYEPANNEIGNIEVIRNVENKQKIEIYMEKNAD